MNRHYYALSGTRPDNRYNYWGDLGYVYADAQSETQPLYRFVASAENLHLFTLDQNGEGSPAYALDGVCCHVPTSSTPNVTPIYRYYHPDSGDHLFGKSETAPPDHNFEGVAFYVLPGQEPGTVPLEVFNFNENDGQSFCLHTTYDGKFFAYDTIRATDGDDLNNKVTARLNSYFGHMRADLVGSEVNPGRCAVHYGHPYEA